MRLHIANCSKQHHDFTYKLPGEKVFRMQNIPAGTQIQLPMEFDDILLKEIIGQHAPYGLREAGKISSLHTYTGLCYSINKTVSMDQIVVMSDHNDQVLTAKAEDLRETTAASIAQGIRDKMAPMEVGVPRVEMELRTDSPSDKPLAEGYEVTRDDSPNRHGGKRSQRQRGRARA